MRYNIVKRFILHTICVVLLSLSGTLDLEAQMPQDSTAMPPKSKVHLKGRVMDQDESPLPFVNIKVEGQMAGAIANLKGEYSFDFESADSIVISYSLIGYEKRQRVLKNPSGNLTLNIVMHPDGKTMNTVEVKETRRQMGQTQTLNINDVKRLPSTTGNGVEDLVATQAGVSTHNELSSQYNVRGGSFDENCVYINGMEVYRPMLITSGQQEGLSVINSDMVEKVDFSAGGFEAKYGDKMSSVLDITYRKPKRAEASLQGSLLGANAYAGYGGKRFSFSNGLRYKTNQYMLGSLDTQGEYSPRFLDYQAYLSWTPHKDWTLDAIGYVSKNDFKFTPATRFSSFGTLENVKTLQVFFDGWEEDQFRTLFGTAKLTHKLNKKSNISLAYSAFSTRERVTYDIQGEYRLDQNETQEQIGVGRYQEHARNILTSSTNSLRLNYDLKHKNHHIQAGLSWKHEKVDEHTSEWESRDSSGYNIPHTGNDLLMIYNLRSINSISSNTTEFYVQDTWRHQSDVGIITVNYGARLSYWDWNGECLFSPRASVGFVPSKNENFTFRLATGMYYQRPFYKEIRDSINQNGNCTILLNKDIKSQRSFQLVVGGDYKFKMAERPFKFTSEIYYKAQSNINPYNVDNLKVVYYGENIATGYVLGADFKLYGEFVPGADSWVSFGLMKAQMTMHGKSIPQPTDQRYNLSFFFTDYFPGTTRWKMSLKASFADGLPFGPPHTGLEQHRFRAPAYKRIDIGMNYRVLDNEDKHLSRNPIRNIWLGLDCFNIFDFSNVSGYFWMSDVTSHMYAVPNYLTGRMLNARFLIEL
ncbi:MAG: TonB-dependent receptor [Bacteroidaceae bacterium]|nr:TonB-dependent receptor [Bacteroidaceae bacterium]